MVGIHICWGVDYSKIKKLNLYNCDCKYSMVPPLLPKHTWNECISRSSFHFRGKNEWHTNYDWNSTEYHYMMFWFLYKWWFDNEYATNHYLNQCCVSMSKRVYKHENEFIFNAKDQTSLRGAMHVNWANHSSSEMVLWQSFDFSTIVNPFQKKMVQGGHL